MSPSNSSSVSSLQGSNGVKNTVCRPCFLSFSSSDECRVLDWLYIQWTSTMKFELFSFRWNSDMTHQSKAITSPPGCPWIARTYNRSSQEFLQYWSRVLLRPFPNMIDPIGIRKGISFFFPKRMSKLRSHRFPVNCTSRVSFLEVNMTYQFHDEFWDASFQRVFLAISIDSNINSNSFP